MNVKPINKFFTLSMAGIILGAGFGGCASVDGNNNANNNDALSNTFIVDDFPETDINTLAQQADLDVFKFGDIAEVTVFNVENLSGSYAVDRNGVIDFPLIGPLSVSGMNTAELQSTLQEKYGEKYLKDPSISVKIEPIQLGKVVVDGAVDSPGVFEVFQIIKLSEAIALAGGVTIDANTKELYLVRSVNGEQKVKLINLKDIRTRGGKDPDVYPSDIIYVQNNNARIAYNEFLRTVPLLSAILIASTR